MAGVDPPIRMTLPITSSAATCEDLPLDGIEINGQSKMWVSSDGTSCAEYKEFNFCANYSFDEYYRNTYVARRAAPAAVARRARSRSRANSGTRRKGRGRPKAARSCRWRGPGATWARWSASARTSPTSWRSRSR